MAPRFMHNVKVCPHNHRDYRSHLSDLELTRSQSTGFFFSFRPTVIPQKATLLENFRGFFSINSNIRVN